MRTLVKVSIPTESGNKSIQDGTLPKVLESTLQELKPEAAYFYTENGRRTAQFVLDVKDSAQMPVIGERFFMQLGAEVTFTPCMNKDDLMRGLQMLEQAMAQHA